jgi:hypothetical protein
MAWIEAAPLSNLTVRGRRVSSKSERRLRGLRCLVVQHALEDQTTDRLGMLLTQSLSWLLVHLSDVSMSI